MPKQCMLCFKKTDILRQVVPKAPAEVCKACGYKVDQVIGFLEYHGVTVIYQPNLFESPPDPPTGKEVTKSTKRGKK